MLGYYFFQIIALLIDFNLKIWINQSAIFLSAILVLTFLTPFEGHLSSLWLPRTLLLPYQHTKVPVNFIQLRRFASFFFIQQSLNFLCKSQAIHEAICDNQQQQNFETVKNLGKNGLIICCYQDAQFNLMIFQKNIQKIAFRGPLWLQNKNRLSLISRQDFQSQKSSHICPFQLRSIVWGRNQQWLKNILLITKFRLESLFDQIEQLRFFIYNYTFELGERIDSFGQYAEAKSCVHATFILFVYNHYSQVIYMLQNTQQKLSATLASPQKHTLANTQASHFLSSPNQMKLALRTSQQTLPESLTFHSRSFEFEDPNFPTHLQEQIEGLQERYQHIHKVLIKYSEQESNLHQQKRGYKTMQIDANSLSKDYSHKLQLIEEIKGLVDKMDSNGEIVQLLENKFQQYYLERHYGGFTCEVGNLSIQQRVDSYIETKQEKPAQSKLPYYSSLIPDSKITYSEEFCQTQEIGYDVYIEIPRIIEIEVPVIIFKLAERAEKQQSDLLNSNLSNIDDIITKYSKPYEELYAFNKEDQGSQPIRNLAHRHSQSSGIASSNIEQPLTEIELVYSEFPQDEKFKLPLESYAQIQSFISNESYSERSHPRTDRETPLSEETILITQKIVNKSIIEKFQQTERAILEENGQLKETINNLKAQIQNYKIMVRQLENNNNRLSHRLQEEIQQSQYLSNKLDQLDAQLLQQKIQCLTHINESKERKIENMAEEMRLKVMQIEDLNNNLMQMQIRIAKQQEMLNIRQEQIISLQKLLDKNQDQLNELAACQQGVIQIASQTEISLKKEVQVLQEQKSQLKQAIKQYKKRLETDGISLQIDQASQIQGIIQTQQYHFDLELKQINQKYEKALVAYKQELSQLHSRLQVLQAKNEEKAQLIKRQQQEAFQRNKQRQDYCNQFEAIIQEYSKELQAKDEQIIALKRQYQLNQSQGKNTLLLDSEVHEALVLLQDQLMKEIKQKNLMAAKLLEIETFYKKDLQQEKFGKQVNEQLTLIQHLTSELSSKLIENQKLKTKIKKHEEQIQAISRHQHNAIATKLQEQNTKLKKVNSKLKRYTSSLQQEIKVLCKVDQANYEDWAPQITPKRCKCQQAA